MADLLPNGTYKIINVENSNSAVDLIHGNPFGTVSGYAENPTDNQSWRVQNLGNNRITLESIAAPGFYASAYVQLHGVPLTGSRNTTIWTVRSVGEGRYQLTTADGQHVWVLPGQQNFLTIVLRPANDNQGTGAQWTFRRL